MARVLVVYHSVTGNTKAMAQAVAQGVKDVPSTEALLKEADQVSVSDLINADAMAFGSPTYFSYMAGTVKAIFDKAVSEVEPVFVSSARKEGEDLISQIQAIIAIFFKKI